MPTTMTRREKRERRQALRDQVRIERAAGNISKRDAARIRAATRFNPEAVDDYLDDLVEDQEDEGQTIARATDGRIDWKKFFENLGPFIEKFLPFIMGLCPA